MHARNLLGVLGGAAQSPTDAGGEILGLTLCALALHDSPFSQHGHRLCSESRGDLRRCQNRTPEAYRQWPIITRYQLDRKSTSQITSSIGYAALDFRMSIHRQFLRAIQLSRAGSATTVLDCDVSGLKSAFEM
jgi:hypothetical protein